METAEIVNGKQPSLPPQSPPPAVPTHLWDLPKLFWRVAGYCSLSDVCALRATSRKGCVLASHDAVWRGLLAWMNLLSLCEAARGAESCANSSLHAFPGSNGSFLAVKTPPSSSPRFGSDVNDGAADGSAALLDFFLNSVLTVRVLLGSYTFVAATDDRTGAYNVQESTVHLTPATVSAPRGRAVARIRLSVRYFTGGREQLEGVVRFSARRQAFVACTSVVGSGVRGPIFTIVVTGVSRRWANQSTSHWQAHQGGMRLVMAPRLLNGRCRGSQITEADVFAVSRPPPKPLGAAVAGGGAAVAVASSPVAQKPASFAARVLMPWKWRL